MTRNTRDTLIRTAILHLPEASCEAERRIRCRCLRTCVTASQVALHAFAANRGNGIDDAFGRALSRRE
jgi:hypothetical protein